MNQTFSDGTGVDPVASRWIFLAMLVMIAGATIGYRAFRSPPAPPPKEIANDPVLVAGREVYINRCLSCHGESGKGDGPIARALTGPPPRNFAEEAWKHGDRPEQALAVVSRGVPDTAMPGWAATLSPSDLKAATAYVYHLGKKPIPKELR